MVIPSNITCEYFLSWFDRDDTEHSQQTIAHLDAYQLSDIQARLLVAALLQGRTSEAAMYASTGKIIRQAIILSGMSRVEVDKQWTLAEEGIPNTTFDQYFNELDHWTDVRHRTKESKLPALFDGQGNWGVASPEYTACRLTCIGETFSEAILKANAGLEKLKVDL